MFPMIPNEGLRVDAAEARRLWEVAAMRTLPFGAEYLVYKYRWGREFCLGAIAEYRRFAYLALVSDKMLTPSQSVDEVWHIHILHTQDYADFGAACGQVLHHAPGMPNERERFLPHYDLTHRLYRASFGEMPPALYWPRGSSDEDTARPAIESVLTRYLQSLPEPLRAQAA